MSKSHNGSTKPPDSELNRYHWYTARFWDGMRVRTWWRLLGRNRFAFSPSRIPTALPTFFANTVNSTCHRWQMLRWRKKIEQTTIDHPPLFIVGHWRSGTTLLHELMVRDQRHGYPSTYDCFSPSHFLSTRKFVSKWFWFIMPDRRPMDNMEAGWDRPQEDEFALLNLGASSIYETLAFPNHGPVGVDSLDMVGLDDRERQRWRDRLQWFLRCVYLREQRRLVLKSPPHLGRVQTLLEMFPKAQFVHIVRDPFTVYASTIRLWKALLETQSVQVPCHDWLPEFVLSNFNRLYTAFEQQRELLGPQQYCEVHYEQLVRDPIGEVARIYQELELGGFQDALPQLQKHVAGLHDYRTNQYQLDDESRALVAERWRSYGEKYGYLPVAAGDAREAPSPE